MLLLDVVPLSLGIEMQGGVMAVVVPRNTPIPCLKESTFTTTENNQTTVEFPVFEGERMMTKDNNLLGQFELTGIPPMPKGKAELDVSFNVDANGILNVTARDRTTGRKSNIVISNDAGRLSTQDIERMLEEAKKAYAEDKAKRDGMIAREEFEAYVTSVQDSLYSPQVAAKVDVGSIEELIAEGLAWLEEHADSTKGEIVGYQKKLERKINQFMIKLYTQRK